MEELVETRILQTYRISSFKRRPSINAVFGKEKVKWTRPFNKRRIIKCGINQKSHSEKAAVIGRNP